MKENWRTDWFILGALAGGIASMIKTLINLFFYKIKLSGVHYVDLAGGLLLGKRKGDKPRTILEYTLGTVADTLMGSLFGATLAWLIGKTPKGFEGYKGALFGTALWSITLSLGALLQIDGLRKPKAKTMLTMLSSSIAFGVGTGLLIKRIHQFDQAEIQQPTAVTIQRNAASNLQLNPAAK